jgi:chromosomal replication initiator protein
MEVHFIVEQPAQSQMFDRGETKIALPVGPDNRSQKFEQSSNMGKGTNGNGSYYDTQNNTLKSFVGNNHTEPTIPNLYRGGNGQNNFGEEPNQVGEDITQQPPNGKARLINESYEEYNQSRAANLNPRYEFNSYVEGSNNRMAVAAARSVAENPGHSYNPLFIYGNVGLGKTHILHAIGHEALRIRPYLNVLYVSSETFTNDLVNSIRERSMEEFRNRYRNIDILMIDDIQFIAGKDSTQEEFFHTFNALHGSNKQIVISSDRPPKAMLILEDRLRSRFEGGLISDIQPPDFETRLAILRNKAEIKAIPIPEDVLEYIARQIQSNIRELEGALTRVVAFALHNRSNLTVEMASQALNEVMYNTRKKVLTPNKVVEAVGQFFNVEMPELKGRSRSADIVLPRQIAMYIIREETETSLVDIGQELGGRDHTTVMHAIDKIEREMETNHQLRQQVNTVIQLLYSEGSR